MTIEQIKVRSAELADKSQIMELNHLSYGFSSAELNDIEEKFETTYEDHLVAIENEKIVAVLRNIPLLQNIRGIFKKWAELQWLPQVLKIEDKAMFVN